MSKEATESGVSSKNQSRLNVMEEIAKRNDEENNEYRRKMGEVTPEAGEEIEEEAEEDAEPDPEEEPEAVKEDPEHELIIDGVATKVPLSKITDAGKRALQKELAADKRLEEATRLLNEAKQYSQPSKDVEKEKPPAVGAEDIQKIQYGTEEEAISTMTKLMSSNRMTPAEIAQLVDSQVSKKLETNDIVTRFKAEFSDIIDDPYLFNIVSMETDKLLQNGEPNTYETYKKAGENIRQWRGVKPDNSINEKREKKKGIVDIKTASTKTAAPTEDKIETVADVIGQMRKARHQI
jgi:hypothetical protein